MQRTSVNVTNITRRGNWTFHALLAEHYETLLSKTNDDIKPESHGISRPKFPFTGNKRIMEHDKSHQRAANKKSRMKETLQEKQQSFCNKSITNEERCLKFEETQI